MTPNVEIPAHPGRTLSPDFAQRLENVADHLGPKDRELLDALLDEVKQGVVLDRELAYAEHTLAALQAGKGLVDTNASGVPQQIMTSAAALEAELHSVRAPTAMELFAGRIERAGLSVKYAVAGAYMNFQQWVMGIFGRGDG